MTQIHNFRTENASTKLKTRALNNSDTNKSSQHRNCSLATVFCSNSPYEERK